MSLIAALVSIFTNLFGFIAGLRHKDVATQVANEANKDAHIEAADGRKTDSDLNKELAHVQSQTDAGLAAVRAAARDDAGPDDRLREQSAAVNDAIARANSEL